MHSQPPQNTNMTATAMALTGSVELQLPTGRVFINHACWFSLTLLFFWLPHISRIFTSGARDLITKFLLHGFRPINLLEKRGDLTSLRRLLPRWAYVVIVMDKNKTRPCQWTKLGWIAFPVFWILLVVFKAVLLFFMPVLVVLRQARSIAITFRLRNLNRQLDLTGNQAELKKKILRLDSKTKETRDQQSGENEEFSSGKKWRK